MAPGVYDVGQNFVCDTTASEAMPIIVRADALGDAMIRFDAVEGFRVLAPHWEFHHLDIDDVVIECNER